MHILVVCNPSKHCANCKKVYYFEQCNKHSIIQCTNYNIYIRIIIQRGFEGSAHCAYKLYIYTVTVLILLHLTDV